MSGIFLISFWGIIKAMAVVGHIDKPKKILIPYQGNERKLPKFLYLKKDHKVKLY